MEFKKIRFQTYSLEKEVEMKLRNAYNFTLYVITDPTLMGGDFEKKIQEVIYNGATAIQLREKNSPTLHFLKRALRLKEIIGKRALFIVNDRVDIAIGCQADGVHLGQEDLRVPVARQILGEDRIIGVSTHSVKEAQRAEKESANYVAIGPIFPTQTKPNSGPPKGVNIISQVKMRVNIPVIAIGGINKENVQKVLKAGADGIAVISAIFKSENVGLATRQLSEIIKNK
jgi:thiamine-phosphate pyrophosphorylase